MEGGRRRATLSSNRRRRQLFGKWLDTETRPGECAARVWSVCGVPISGSVRIGSIWSSARFGCFKVWLVGEIASSQLDGVNTTEQNRTAETGPDQDKQQRRKQTKRRIEYRTKEKERERE